MIMNANPGRSELDETMHALRYAAVASEIVIARKVDTGRSRSRCQTPDMGAQVAERTALIEDLWQEIDELKAELMQMHSQCASIEEETREEVTEEMAEQLAALEVLSPSSLHDQSLGTVFIS